MNEEIARRRREFFEPTTSETRPKNDLKLTDLPVEILEEIFYFLPADIICKDIHRTCKRLYKTARSPVFWSSYLKVGGSLNIDKHCIFSSARASTLSPRELWTQSLGLEPLHSNKRRIDGRGANV